MVYPSGLAPASSVIPSVVAAPGLLTITIGWPRVFSAAWARARPVRSVLPPGPHGTISVIGRSGYSARAARGVAASAAPVTSRAAAATAIVRRRSLLIRLSPLGCEFGQAWNP